MKLYSVGSRFRVYLWEDEDGLCPALEYLKLLWSSGQGKEDAADTLDRYLKQFGDHGAPRGEERCRFFEGEDVFELKAHGGGGARLLGFYHPQERAVVIFSHGFDKPAGNKAYRPEIRRAQQLRRLLQAKSASAESASAESEQSSSAKRASRRKDKK